MRVEFNFDEELKNMAQTWRILAKNVTRHSGERRRKVFIRIISHGKIRNEVPNANIQVLKILVYVALLSSIYQMPVLPHTRPHRRDFLSQKEQHYASRSKMSSQKAGRYNAKPPSANWLKNRNSHLSRHVLEMAGEITDVAVSTRNIGDHKCPTNAVYNFWL